MKSTHELLLKGFHLFRLCVLGIRRSVCFVCIEEFDRVANPMGWLRALPLINIIARPVP